MIYFFYLMNHKYIFCSMQSATSNLNYQINVVQWEDIISLQNVVLWKNKVTDSKVQTHQKVQSLGKFT